MAEKPPEKKGREQEEPEVPVTPVRKVEPRLEPGRVVRPTVATHGREEEKPPRSSEGTGEMYCYPLRYPPRYTEGSLAPELARRVAGRPADGSRQVETGPLSRVIWVDAGDEVLVHLDSFKVRLLDSLIVASLDLECDQTGRQALVCVFATGRSDDPAGLLMTTDELPRGNALLASRWGEVVQNAMWSALLGLVTDHAEERRLVPVGISASGGVLQLLTVEAAETLATGKGSVQ